MVINNGLLVASVSHRRVQPTENSFTYRVYYLCFALSQMQRMKSALLGIDAFRLFSFFQHDHGDGTANNDAWIRTILRDWSLHDAADGDIELLTMPRLFGYAFNPVSFWFCRDVEGNVRAVLSEVNNTFGERHCYISFHDDKRPIKPEDEMRSRKVFHVSPFLNVEGEYRYHFRLDASRAAITIDHVTDAGTILTTSLTGKRVPLSSRNLAIQFICTPLLTFKVTGLIYWQALKLVRKKIRYHRKPQPPTTTISR